jgi:alpha-beta hydrolase superfamily lysophospholipase
MIVKLLRRGIVVVILAMIVTLALRVWDTQRGPSLEPWHTYVPADMRADEIDKSDWAQYLRHEESIFSDVRREVVDKIDEAARVPGNRYFSGSPIYPGHFKQDFNRSYVLEPDGTPVGAVVLLHGLTDSPYSLRHVARWYRDAGFVVVAIRLPAHGTVPAALTDVDWEDWAAATRLAMREARRRAGPSAPLHIVGFSNGGALAMKYELEALADARLPRADRLILISPMIGITSFARFAGLAAIPALLPAFAKAAWLGIIPEFNPFKYNSFPVNGARQSHRLTAALREEIANAERDGRLAKLPPVLTFQSVVDFTVSTPAVISGLYDHLPANGSELVLFDLNRAAGVSPLLRDAAETVLSRILPAPPRRYRTVIITNVAADSYDVVERATDAGQTAETSRKLGLAFPANIFSLSHVALPFPVTDSLYGQQPDDSEDFGIHLGAMAPRGERGVLIVNLDTLLRVSSNPFLPYMQERMQELMSPGRGGKP